MKNSRFHIVYLTIIGFLAFQYWTKSQALEEAVGSIEQFDKLLRRDNEVVEKTSTMLRYEIEKQVQSYPNKINMSFSEKAKKIMSGSSSINKWLEKQKTDFIIFSGGFDKNDSKVLANRFSPKASNSFFLDQKINEIRDSLTQYQVYLDDISYKEKLQEMQKQYGSRNLISNDTFWQSLKNKTNADALAQLTFLQNQIILDKIPYLNYTYNLVASDMVFDAYKLAIAPKKAVLILGDKFEMDAYVAKYSSFNGSDVSFWINNQEIPVKEGVAHFVNEDKTIGKKTVKAIARIRNPLTGATMESISEFEYEVLPKCSRDCQ
jgi:hypothetical protein